MNTKTATIFLTVAVLAGACGSTTPDETALGEREQLPPGAAVNGAPIGDDLPLFDVESDEVGIHEVEPTPTPEPEPPPTPEASAGAVEPQEPTPTPQPTPAPSPEPCRAFVLDGPTFPSNQATLTEDGFIVVEQLIAELNANACGRDSVAAECAVVDMEVALQGHTDDVPTNRSGGNLQLSTDRAQSVANVFIAADITVRSVEGFADTRPAPAPDPDDRTLDERRQANRRTEIQLFCTS